jgi:hypothetical protein
MQISSSSAVAATQAQETQSLVSSMAALYSAKVGGTSYSAEVQLSAGSYTATIPALPGISASGGTILEAEDNLNLRINVLA